MKPSAKIATVVLTSVASAAVLYVGCFFYHKRLHKYLRRFRHRTVVECRTLNAFGDVENTFYQLCHESRVLGLDCEWVTVNGKRQRVALIQLAPSPSFCVLLRVCFLASQHLPQHLKDILHDDSIIKVGVGIHDDAQKLLQDHFLHVRGCLDLRYAVNRFPELDGVPLRGLQALSHHLLSVRPEKSWKIRCSNWEADVLTQEQICYAAEDAFLSVEIFDQIVRCRLSLSCFRPFWHEKLKLATIEACRSAVDLPFRTRTSSVASPERNVGSRPPSSRKLGCFRSYRIRRTPLYDNCVLQAPDGQPLCTCDYKKARWYVDRELGEEISEEPVVVRLKFEPANRPILDSEYYIHAKDNACVVCGSKESLLRKNVVPREYRRHFPDVMKDHISHDILLLCVQCHQLSNLQDLALRYILADECEAPFESHEDTKCKEDPMLRKIKSAGRALLLSRDRLPTERASVLEQVLKDHYGTDEVTQEQIKEAAELDTSVYNADYVPHGEKVVDHYKKNGGLIHFETRWRKHFLETMKPRYLPSMWSVDHHHKLLAIKVAKGRGKNLDLEEIGITREQVEKAVEKVGAEWLLDEQEDNGIDCVDADDDKH